MARLCLDIETAADEQDIEKIKEAIPQLGQMLDEIENFYQTFYETRND